MARTRRSIEEILAETEEGKKTCTHCKETKPVGEFAADKRHKDGLQSRCKECTNLLRRTKYRAKISETEKAYHQEHKGRINARKRKYMRRHREYFEEKHKEWIAKNRQRHLRRKRRWHQANKDHENAQARRRMSRWVKNNRERHRENCRRREMRKKNAEGIHDLTQWEALLEMCNGICLACGETEDITHDHIIPLAWGGTDYIDNIQVLCRPCNCVKQDHYAIDYRPRHVRRWAFLEAQSG